MNKISIITVNYNDKIGLEKTIKSVISQENAGFEFLVIDGGSTDGSKGLIEQNSGKISYWVSEPDTGIYNAMNKGIKKAKGDFLIFMNSGDMFFDENVLSSIEQDLEDDFDIYYGNNYKVKENGSKRLKTYPEKLSFSFFYSSSINHQSTFIRKSLFDKYFYYNETYKIASDWEFFIYTICYANVPSKYLKKTIALYDFTGISSDSNFSELFLKEKRQTIRKYFPTFIDDYKNVSELTSKRYIQFQFIKQNKYAWNFLKVTINFILLFLPKIEK